VAAKRRGRQSRVRAAVAALPQARPAAASAGRTRFAPSRRSIAIGLAIVAVAGTVYAGARESSVFAVRSIEVSGAPPAVQAQIRAALAPVVGTSLLALDGAAIQRHVEALPSVLSVAYDRSFPHTLHIVVVPEKAVAVLRRGRESWLVSARGRVVAKVPRRLAPSLPRIWVPTATAVLAGDFLDTDHGGTAARSLALVGRFPARIAFAAFAHGDLLFRLRSGLELRLGDPTDVRLKLAIARRAMRALPAGATYLDVSVPRRPVAGADPQVSGGA
jgi:cell division protein FtsQ